MGTLQGKKSLNDWILELYIVIWRKKSRSHFWNGDFLEIPPLFHEFFKRLDKKKDCHTDVTSINHTGTLQAEI